MGVEVEAGVDMEALLNSNHRCKIRTQGLVAVQVVNPRCNRNLQMEAQRTKVKCKANHLMVEGEGPNHKRKVSQHQVTVVEVQ
jgi:hypothetical protein